MKIGFAITGSFCTHEKAKEVLLWLVKNGHDVTPFVSRAVSETDTRFGRAADLLSFLSETTGHAPVSTIAEAEIYGPVRPLDLLIILPCTGNTLSKMANGITDTPVTMTAKAHLRQDRPLLLAPASNDALSANLRNIGTLLSRKSVYFLPLLQDDPMRKPHSLVADFARLPEAMDAAIQGKQLRPLFLS